MFTLITHTNTLTTTLKMKFSIKDFYFGKIYSRNP